MYSVTDFHETCLNTTSLRYLFFFSVDINIYRDKADKLSKSLSSLWNQCENRSVFKVLTLFFFATWVIPNFSISTFVCLLLFNWTSLQKKSFYQHWVSCLIFQSLTRPTNASLRIRMKQEIKKKQTVTWIQVTHWNVSWISGSAHLISSFSTHQ